MPFTIKKANGKGLCYTCKESHITSYANGREEIVCNSSYPISIRGQVEHCNQYRTATEKSEYQLEKIAWIIDVDASCKMVGFVPPGSERHKKLIDND